MKIEVTVYTDLGYKIHRADGITINGKKVIFSEATNSGIYFIEDGKEKFINFKQIKTLV